MRFIWGSAFLFTGIIVWAAGVAFAAEVPAEQAPKKHKSYRAAQVLMIDHDARFIGIQTAPEVKDGPQQKLSFPVDKRAYAANPRAQVIQFEEVAVGDNVDLHTEVGPDGKQSIVYILDYNR